MSTINTAQALTKEAVVQPKIASTTFRINGYHESVLNRIVVANIEFGPYDDKNKGVGTKRITVWEGTAYDAIRDTWTNADLLSTVTTILNA